MIIGIIPEWYGEIEEFIVKENIPPFVKYYFLRLLVEYYTWSYFLKRDVSAYAASIQIKKSFLESKPIDEAVYNLQQERFSTVAGRYMKQVDMESVGMTEPEAKMLFRYWKKKKQSPEFYESEKAPYNTADNIIQDNVFRIDLSNFKYVIYLINNGCGDYDANCREYNDVLQNFRELHLTIFDNEDFQPSFLDFWLEANGDVRDAQLNKECFQDFITSISRDICMDEFLQYIDIVDGKTATKKVNLIKKNWKKQF